MNRLGMLVDISHVNNYTMIDVLDTSVAPGQSLPLCSTCSNASIEIVKITIHNFYAVIFSHSSSYTVCPHSRNVPDNILMKLVNL